MDETIHLDLPALYCSTCLNRDISRTKQVRKSNYEQHSFPMFSVAVLVDSCFMDLKQFGFLRESI